MAFSPAPPPIVSVPVKPVLLALEPVICVVLPLAPLKVIAPVPLIPPESVRGAVLSPLFLSPKLNAVDPKVQVPELMTGVLGGRRKVKVSGPRPVLATTVEKVIGERNCRAAGGKQCW